MITIEKILFLLMLLQINNVYMIKQVYEIMSMILMLRIMMNIWMSASNLETLLTCSLYSIVIDSYHDEITMLNVINFSILLFID